MSNPNTVFSRLWHVFHANEDGTTEQKEVSIELTDSLLFRISRPAYMRDSENDEFVIAASKANVIAMYEYEADQYSKNKLILRSMLSGEKKLFIGVANEPLSRIAANIGMTMATVVQYADADGEMHAVALNDDGSPDKEIELDGGRLLPDKPELREKGQTLINSIRNAAAIMTGFLSTSDPEAYLLAISNDWKAPGESNLAINVNESVDPSESNVAQSATPASDSNQPEALADDL